MKTQKYSIWLKAGIILVALCAAGVCFFIAPVWGRFLLTDLFPELRSWFLPWLILLWVCAVPFFAALGCAFKVSDEIGRDNSFSAVNAKMLRAIGFLSVGDAVVFVCANIAFLAFDISHPSVALCSVVVALVMCCAAIAAFVLSKLIYKASEVAEENELTI